MAESVMAVGICDACGAVTTKPVAIATEEMKMAVRNGFQPRYGRADCEAGVMAAIGSDFGISGLQPPPELQDADHNKAVAGFVASLQTRNINSHMGLCCVCSVLAKQRIAMAADNASHKEGSLACSLCGARISGLSGKTGSFYILEWLQPCRKAQ